MHQDKTVEVRIKFLNAAPIIRPFIELDVDQVLNFNEALDMLRNIESSQCVLETCKKTDQLLLKIINSLSIQQREHEEQARIYYEQQIK